METKNGSFIQEPAAHARGVALLEKIHGGHAGAALVSAVADVCPDFASMTIEWALDGVMGRPGLDLMTREFVVIASCVTLGYATPQLEAHIEGALELGATPAQIVEVILQMLFYAGGAATSNALRLAGEIFVRRGLPVRPVAATEARWG